MARHTPKCSASINTSPIRLRKFRMGYHRHTAFRTIDSTDIARWTNAIHKTLRRDEYIACNALGLASFTSFSSELLRKFERSLKKSLQKIVPYGTAANRSDIYFGITHRVHSTVCGNVRFSRNLYGRWRSSCRGTLHCKKTVCISCAEWKDSHWQ